MQTRRFLRKGCEAFLALVLDTKRGQVNMEDIPMIKEFPDVFPEELPGLPLEREVDLAIEVLHATTLISRAPYRMAPTELKELKTQYKSYWTRDSSNLVFCLEVHRFCLSKRNMALSGCAFIIDK